MSLRLIKEMVNSRHGIAMAMDDMNREVARFTVRPIFFYKDKKKNYEDINVPAYAELLLGDTVCSNELVDFKELHECVLQASVQLTRDVDCNMLVISTSSKDTYALLQEMSKELYKQVPNIQIFETEEAQALLNTWPTDVVNGLNVTTNGTFKNIFFVIKNNSLETYKGEWWDKSQEIMKK